MADGMQIGTGSHAPQSAAALRSSAWLLEHISAQAPLLSLGDERSKQLFQKLVDNYHRARQLIAESLGCLLYTSPSPRDVEESRMPSSA